MGSGLGFHVDFDPTSGFWLDKGEYESLRSHNLHDELHLICSPEYRLAAVRMPEPPTLNSPGSSGHWGPNPANGSTQLRDLVYRTA
ncbi:MAG: hypothetical protein R3B67_06250 [Phycisphaerales bacterium]